MEVLFNGGCVNFLGFGKVLNWCARFENAKCFLLLFGSDLRGCNGLWVTMRKRAWVGGL